MLFYAQVHHLDFDTSKHAGAVGILWMVAQQTSLRDITVVASGSLSGIDVGYSGSFGYVGAPSSCGGGGTVNNITVLGGRFGVRVSASQWYLDSIRASGQTEAGVMVDEAWAVVMLDVQVKDAAVGLLTIGQDQNVVIVSSHFGPNLTNGTAIVPRFGPKANRQLLLSNVSATSDTKMLVDKVLPLPAGGNSKTWFLSGQVYQSGQPSNTLDPNQPGHLNASLPAVATEIPIRQRPRAAGSSPPANAKTCCGAKGDGTTDDTKALQTAIDTHATVFLPYGVYLLSDTLTLKPNTALVGEGMPFLVLKDGAPGFGDPAKPKPMVLAPSDGDAETVLADLALSTEHSKSNANLGAVLLSWGAGPRSSTFDLHMQLFAPVHTAMHITGKGGGIISNTWGWGADHNLVRLLYRSCRCDCRCCCSPARRSISTAAEGRAKSVLVPRFRRTAHAQYSNCSLILRLCLTCHRRRMFTWVPLWPPRPIGSEPFLGCGLTARGRPGYLGRSLSTTARSCTTSPARRR